MGYHANEIPKGEFGKWSKIKEEFLEAEDAYTQENPVMLLLELSDLLGAIGEFALKKYNISIYELLAMTKATRSAFEDGTRK